MKCIICGDMMSNKGRHQAMSLKCGHLFGSCCILRWIEIKKSCPICKKEATYKEARLLICDDLVVSDEATVIDFYKTIEKERSLRLEYEEKCKNYELVIKKQADTIQTLTKQLNEGNYIQDKTSTVQASVINQEEDRSRQVIESNEDITAQQAKRQRLESQPISSPQSRPFPNEVGPVSETNIEKEGESNSMNTNQIKNKEVSSKINAFLQLLSPTLNTKPKKSNTQKLSKSLRPSPREDYNKHEIKKSQTIVHYFSQPLEEKEQNDQSYSIYNSNINHIHVQETNNNSNDDQVSETKRLSISSYSQAEEVQHFSKPNDPIIKNIPSPMIVHSILSPTLRDTTSVPTEGIPPMNRISTPSQSADQHNETSNRTSNPIQVNTLNNPETRTQSLSSSTIVSGINIKSKSDTVLNSQINNNNSLSEIRSKSSPLASSNIKQDPMIIKKKTNLAFHYIQNINIILSRCRLQLYHDGYLFFTSSNLENNQNTLYRFSLDSNEYQIIYQTNKTIFDIIYIYYSISQYHDKIVVLTPDPALTLIDINQQENNITIPLSGVPSCIAYSTELDKIAIGISNIIYIYDSFDFTKLITSIPISEPLKACLFVEKYLLYSTSKNSFYYSLTSKPSHDIIGPGGYFIYSCAHIPTSNSTTPTVYSICIPQCSSQATISIFTITIRPNDICSFSSITSLKGHKDMIYMCRPTFDMHPSSLSSHFPTVFIADERDHSIVSYALDQETHSYSLFSTPIQGKCIRSVISFFYKNMYYLSIVSDDQIILCLHK